MTRAARLHAGLACLAVAACAAPPRPEPATPPVAAAPARTPRAEVASPVRDAATVQGAWDVARFEGYQPRRLSGTVRAAFVDFRAHGVALRLECNYSGRAGRIKGGRFVTAPDPDAIQTTMGCGRDREARDDRFFSFFDKGPAIEQIGPDRLRLRTGGSELILERPSLRRLRFLPDRVELQGKWRMLELTRYVEEGGFTGIGLSEVPGRIEISGDRLLYTRCPRYAAAFRWSADGRLHKVGGTAPPGGPADCPELAEPAHGPELPAAADVLALLHASPKVERTAEGAILLSTERLGLLLTRAPCESREPTRDGRGSRTVDCASPE